MSVIDRVFGACKPIWRLGKAIRKMTKRASAGHGQARPGLRDYYTAVGFVAVVAVCLRLVHGWYVYLSPFHADAEAYLNLTAMFRQPFLKGPLNFFPPGYPLALHLMFLGGEPSSVQRIQTVQAVISGFCVFPLAAIGRWMAGARVGIIAATLFAFSRLSIVQSGLIMSEAFATAAVILSFYAFIKFCSHPGWIRAVFTGLAVAAAGHFRTNLLIVLAAYCLLALFPWRNTGLVAVRSLRRLTLSVVIGAACVLAVLPWSVRNTMITRRPTFIAANTANTLYLGSNPITDVRVWDVDFPEWYRQAYNGLVTSDDKNRLAYDFIRAYPVYQVSYMLPRRIKYLFSDIVDNVWPWGDPRGGDGNFITFPFGPYFWVPLLPSGVSLLLGLLGFFIPIRRMWPLAPVAVVLFSAPFMLLHTQGRYRGPFDCFILIPAAIAVTRLIGNADFRLIFRRVWLTLAAVALVATGFNLWRFGRCDLLHDEGRLVGEAEALKHMRDGMFEVEVDTTARLPVKIPLGRVAVRPGIESHIYTSFACEAVTTDVGRGKTPNIEIAYFDERGAKVTFPESATGFLPHGVELDTKHGLVEHPWRILRLPGMAKEMSLTLTLNQRGIFRFWNLRMCGPFLRYSPTDWALVPDERPDGSEHTTGSAKP